MKYKEIQLNSARNCLKYILKVFDIKDIYIPYYLCNAIRNTAVKENCSVHFYHISSEFKPTKNFKEDAFILYPNYFGICSNIVKELDKQYKNLIIDNAHAFLARPYGLASFNSIRKFFPTIRDGAILYTKETKELNIKKDEYSYTEKILDYEEICKNEYRIEKDTIMGISETSLNLYKKQNIEDLINLKKEAFNKLHNKYKNTNNLKIEIKPEDVPFCYPYLAKNEQEAKQLVNELEQQNFLIYRYWNKLPNSYPESIFYNRLIPIPLS